MGGKRVKYLLMATVGVQKFEALVFSQKRQRNRADPDQTASDEQSDLRLPCLLFGQAFCKFLP